jgi:Zn-dependent protease
MMRFSHIEKEHLLKAWVCISFAFAAFHTSIFTSAFLLAFLVSLITVGIAFMLHEIAHKYVAEKYGCFAEFRSDDRMLLFMVILAFVSPIIFAAPGAVYIMGHVTKEKNGKISLAGPAVNILLAMIFMGTYFFLKKYEFIASTLFYGFQINGFIALFNMIPFMNFDGEKIIKWNKFFYFAALFISGALVILSMLPIF